MKALIESSIYLKPSLTSAVSISDDSLNDYLHEKFSKSESPQSCTTILWEKIIFGSIDSLSVVRSEEVYQTNQFSTGLMPIGDDR